MGLKHEYSCTEDIRQKMLDFLQKMEVLFEKECLSEQHWISSQKVIFHAIMPKQPVFVKKFMMGPTSMLTAYLTCTQP